MTIITLTEGTSFITLTLSGIQYKGVVVEQTMEPSQTKQVVAFTAMANSGVTLWGYRTGDAPTGIEEVIDGKSPDSKEEFLSRPWYDLNGQRIKRPTHKGIYIIDKQKVLVR